MAAPAPLKIVLVGAGAMGMHWLRTLVASPDAHVVGLVDLNEDLARAGLAELGLEGVAVASRAAELAVDLGADAVINVTIPAAHHAINTEVLFAGIPVLCEKPIAPTVHEALSLAAASEASGQLLMVSQSRRYYESLEQFRAAVRELGTLGIATNQFFKNPELRDFHATLEFPLLLDMSIHPFDSARYVLGAEPVAVTCTAFTPPWSDSFGAPASIAHFEFEGGIQFLYTGSWSSPGLETSWNGEWRVSGSGGSATWDGEQGVESEVVTAAAASPAPDAWSRPAGSGPEIEGSFAEFVDAVRTGRTPGGEIHTNVTSLAMVEAAVRSATESRRVLIADVIEEAWAEAVSRETNPQVLARLTAWGSGAAGLAGEVSTGSTRQKG